MIYTLLSLFTFPLCNAGLFVLYIGCDQLICTLRQYNAVKRLNIEIRILIGTGPSVGLPLKKGETMYSDANCAKLEPREHLGHHEFGQLANN